ncbi:MAG: MBL fold metallo-hydrolase [Chloroflexi bacterium]|nr:MBL fold metallo-hydrolase [Chloroflexota bacterium]
MIDEILPNLYRIEVILPRSPLHALNSYLVKGPERFLIIDTGMNREECLSTMSSALAKLEVDLEKTDFFITHLHSDHLGLVGTLATDTSTVYFDELEAGMVNAEMQESRWQQMSEIYLAHGFPEAELKTATDSHPGRRYGVKRHIDFRILHEGDTIEIGDYSFRSVKTPGHSPGHTCLFENKTKTLIAGDHILADITPNITHWPEMADSLGQYLLSLDKVYALEVKLVLPGHHSFMSDHRERIRQLRAHHQARLNETLAALADGVKTAYEVAPHLTWEIECDSWAQFPAQQKWFAVGETLAHLLHLEARQKVRGESRDHQVVFSRV